MKVFRNIYFYSQTMFKKGSGSIDIQYTGQIFNNAKNIKNFDTEYDKDQDLLIICDSCAAKKYRNITKQK